MFKKKLTFQLYQTAAFIKQKIGNTSSKEIKESMAKRKTDVNIENVNLNFKES